MKTLTLLLVTLFVGVGTSFSQNKNKAPQIDYLIIDGKKSPSVVPLNPGEKYLIKVSVTDPENDKLKATWELYAQSELIEAIDKKRKAVALPDTIIGSLENVMLDVPTKQGDYKLVLTVTDSSKNISTASIQLKVL
jgi:hypothetical protein